MRRTRFSDLSILAWSLLLVFLLSGCETAPQTQVAYQDIKIIPQPSQIEEVKGPAFTLDAHIVIYSDPGFEQEAAILKQLIREQTGLELNQVMQSMPGPAIVLKKVDLVDEAYNLSINSDHIRIEAGSGAGILHGSQTLAQMLPADKQVISLPLLEIKDEPHFSHRGLLLDCSRHFWSVEVVKKYIDVLSRYKMNVLHWHLTEDQGWRAEIEAYPRLTEVGAWRTEADGSRYGGFYIKEEMEGVVDYAAERHITVIPEIEMPGHSLAALSAYPHLACTDGPFEVTPEWGVFKDVYCAGNDSTFLFLENVLTEIMEIFPSKYIHIGGDESPKFRWENCDKCQARMQAEGLEDEHALQSYFIRRIQAFLQESGRELIGWDEILEGGLAEGAVVQSWRGMQGGIDAAKAGNQAIMSPTSHCYLDYGLQKIDLETIYGFDPLPAELNAKEQSYIIGGECNMWTEHVPDEANLDSKVLPRMIGLAEVLWSYNPDREYEEFTQRLEAHYPFLQQRFNVGFEKIPIAFVTKVVPEGLQVQVNSALADLEAHVAYHHDNPTDSSPLWPGDSVFIESNVLKIQAIQGDRVFPQLFTLTISVHAALGKTPQTEQEFSSYYTAGGKGGLTDGVLGTEDFRDGHWQGYQGNDLEFVIDLEAVKDVKSVSTQYHQYNNAWIFAPQRVTYMGSTDGKAYTEFATVINVTSPKEKGQFVVPMEGIAETAVPARYVKIVVESIGPCPDWHDAAGSDSWLFIDEIAVTTL